MKTVNYIFSLDMENIKKSCFFCIIKLLCGIDDVSEVLKLVLMTKNTGLQYTGF